MRTDTTPALTRLADYRAPDFAITHGADLPAIPFSDAGGGAAERGTQG